MSLVLSTEQQRRRREEKRHSGVRQNLRTLQQTAKLGSKAERVTKQKAEKKFKKLKIK